MISYYAAEHHIARVVAAVKQFQWLHDQEVFDMTPGLGTCVTSRSLDVERIVQESCYIFYDFVFNKYFKC